MKDISIIGIDIAKTVFHVCCMDKKGRVAKKGKIHREDLLEYMKAMPKTEVAMESCGGSNYWARTFIELGFKVKLIPPQFVKPFVKNQKNDSVDAEAICEASLRPTMRYSEIKTIEQQTIQHFHRIKQRLTKNRVALSNEIRGILLEHGIAVSKGSSGDKWFKKVREALEKKSAKLTQEVELLVNDLMYEFKDLEAKELSYVKKIEKIVKQNPQCQRLETIPGVGKMIASAIVASVSDVSLYKNGRQFAASLGLVPRQHSTGGRSRLGGITKRGDKYIRQLLIHGSRSLLYRADKKMDRFSLWASRLKKSKGWNRTSVAIANKQARIIWAILKYGCDYQTNFKHVVKNSTPLKKPMANAL